MSNEKEKQPEPNVTLVAKDKEGKVNIDKAVVSINLAGSKSAIKLPEPADQAKPFYHKDADLITAALPQLYKTFKADKGKK